MRFRHLIVVAMISCSVTASGDTEVTRTDSEVTLSNSHCTVVLDLERGCGAVKKIALAGDDANVISRASLALYFKEAKHWVDEHWVRATAVSVSDMPGGKCVEVKVEDFGGFRLTKSVALLDDSPVVRFSYCLEAIRAVRPELICPLGLGVPPNVDQLVTEGGTVSAADVSVSDFAMQLLSTWFAFRADDGGHGIAVVPMDLPPMHRVNWLGRKPDGSLTLVWRLHPMKTLTLGEQVSFSYSLVPFSGAAEPPVELARSVEAVAAQVATDISRPNPAGEVETPWGLPVVYCGRAQNAPSLDGKLDDSCWRDAGVISGMRTISGKALAQAQTTGYVAHDDDNVYVGVRCDEPYLPEMRTDAKPGSSTVWTDDCIELFIATGEDAAGYAHLIVNAAGVRQDNLPGERPITYEWSAVTGREDNAWTAEVKIPFRDLDVASPEFGDVWRLNLCRSRLPRREATCWSPTLKDFHVPERFGVMAFGTPDVMVRRIDVGLSGQLSGRVLKASVVNNSPGPRVVSGTVQVSCEGSSITQRPVELRLAPEMESTLETEYQATRSGRYRVALKLADATGQVSLFDGAFSSTVYSAGLNSAIYPAEEDGNRLCVAKGTVQHFFFVPANHSKANYESFSFVLLLPEGVEVMQATGDSVKPYFRPSLRERETIEDGEARWVRWVFESDRALGPRDIKDVRFYSTWCGALVPSDDIEPGTYPFRFYLASGDEREAEHAGELVVMPAPRGEQPKLIRIGMSGWTLSPTSEFWNALLDTYEKCGINLMDGSHVLAEGGQWAAALTRRNMQPWRLMYWYWWNDEYLDAHPDDAAVNFDGKPDDKRVCPEVMASSDDAIAGLMAPLVEQALAGSTVGSWWDLEGPACFDACFCERCIAAFRQDAVILEEQDLTPLAIQAKYGEQWVDFACRQSARIAAKMKSFATQRGADWRLAVYCGVQNGHTRRAYRVDWRTLIPQIDVASPSFYSFGASDLATRFTAGVTEFVDFVRRIKEIPVWATLSTGYGRGDHFIADGRLTRMQIIKSVAFGAQGTIQWWWGPVDGRHYHAYAEASSIVSRLERFFTEGSLAPDELSGDQTPGTSRVAWRVGDRLLVMLFNDTSAEALQATALIPDGYRIAEADEGPQPVLDEGVLSAETKPLDCRWFVLAQ